MKKLLKKILGQEPQYGFFGFFDSWSAATGASTGWHAGNVLEKVRASLLKIKNGEAVYERDSVLFDKIQYSWPLLAGLMRAALENDKELHVADFGGSLGTTYFQNRKFLTGLKKLQWNVIEQENYAREGIKSFQGDKLKFFTNFDTVAEQKPNVLVVSSVIQYLENPFAMVEKFVNSGIKYIIFDRTSFLDTPDHKIAIQKVKPSIYKAIFPIWFFNYEKFLNLFADKYEVIAEFPAFVAAKYEVEGIAGGDRGFILQKKSLTPFNPDV